LARLNPNKDLDPVATAPGTDTQALPPAFLQRRKLRHHQFMNSEPYGVMPDGREVRLFTLRNNSGLEMKVINYGGIIANLTFPDRNRERVDVVLGHDNLDGYLHRSRYFGALIGRYGNRIKDGRFVLNHVQYELPINNGKNHLHGGLKGFDKVFWELGDYDSRHGRWLNLTYRSWDGEEGYPGNLEAAVSYSLSEANELRIEYFGKTDAETIVNLTNHSYFNLAGEGTILDHELMINADHFTPDDETLIPTGEFRCVHGTPMDFTASASIGAHINDDDQQLQFAGGGYDHNFVLNRPHDLTRVAARVHEPKSGRTMEVLTTEPGIQFYSGNFLNGSIVGKGGRAYEKHSGFCLETQHFPDSPNHEDFPSTVLRPGEEYSHTTIYRFSAQ
jgi:aldose 1-epimerase